MTSKKETRAWIRQRKKAYTVDELLKKSRVVMERVETHPRVIAAHTILMYASLPDEVDTTDTLEWLRQAGKKVLLPEVVGDGEMRLRVYNGPSALREGSFHIMEPTGDVYEECAPIDVAIVPGMAFDLRGHRLGRGKGYYDRFLHHIDIYKIGVCFDFQLLEQVPLAPHDIMMDEVISEI